MKQLATYIKRFGSALKRYWQENHWRKFWIILAGLLVLAIGSMYGIARWYQAHESDKPLIMGTTFVPAYAEALGLNAEATMDALIDELGIRHFRLTSYWNQLEAEQGNHDFTVLDWQFEKVEQADGEITLALGLRQPRWPECHKPDWARELPDGEWQHKLSNFISAVVERYKDSPALRSYQLENEFLHETFGECDDFDRGRVATQLELIKSIDPDTPVIMSRSSNAPSLPLGNPVPDEYGLSIYRRVWEPTLDRYFQYPFPAWYYAFLAGSAKLMQDKDSIIHELQAEAWPPRGQFITDVSLEVQNESIDADRLAATFQFGRDTGIREMYLWGAEYWLYRKQILGDPSLWEIAKAEYRYAE